MLCGLSEYSLLHGPTADGPVGGQIQSVFIRQTDNAVYQAVHFAGTAVSDIPLHGGGGVVGQTVENFKISLAEVLVEGNSHGVSQFLNLTHQGQEKLLRLSGMFEGASGLVQINASGPDGLLFEYRL